MAKSIIHATSWNGDDRTLCGFAYEGACTGDEAENAEPTLAERGELVTCDECRTLIAYCKTFKRNRQP